MFEIGVRAHRTKQHQLSVQWFTIVLEQIAMKESSGNFSEGDVSRTGIHFLIRSLKNLWIVSYFDNIVKQYATV